MDSLSQIVLGGAVAAAIAPAGHRRAALLAGAALGTLPDLDALWLGFMAADRVAVMTEHRSSSHSLLVLPRVAAALWWARSGRGARLKSCEVSREAAGDPDRFVAELAAWPQQRLTICNYLVGVMSTIAAEVKYPDLALEFGAGGDVTLRFRADIPRIELQKGESHEIQLLGHVDGDALRDRKGRGVAGGFEKALDHVADRALRRFPQPKGIPEGTVVEVQYLFSVTQTP